MSGIAIYIEGGGGSVAQRAQLRIGFRGLFTQFEAATTRKKRHWKITLCGPREETYRAFITAVQTSPDMVNLLLVDSEEAVSSNPDGELPAAADRMRHLEKRDKWVFPGAGAEQVHLMVQCMEAWIAADVGALERYYRQGFAPRALPQRDNLEEEPKADLHAKLLRATENTQKGRYDKIKHARDLLAEIDPATVAQRCPHFKILMTWLENTIASL